ncbi:metal-dependent hydrolase [Thermococcus paralvinellae]|uniref:Membrane-bound metal-dependent hydrolase n=1 Tax=Thermococcus paralvinellae TaxID=582419 RepID=W0I8B0_9EURY|nr:hypothetical protein [Thermococcus paralvinellae]AHF80658.1 Hypothetical protein TES1_1278 [Thermococcus paralvinellae]
MPFTPFHFGSALLFATLFGYLDFLTFMIANVIIDFEPFLVLSFDLDLRYGYPLHGFFHTFIGGSLVALALAEVMAKFYKHLGKEINIKKLRITALSGVWLHIVLDSFIYTDIKPFFPLSWNPFYGVFSASEVYGFCIGAFLLGVPLYLLRKIRASS